MGDVVLEQQDILENREYPDAAVTATWSIDLHVPTAKQSQQFPGAEFRSVASFGKKNPYAIPYRCLYSRNIENLFMAGRNISVTHVALGTVRVMRTTGMMGEVVGMAAAIARRHDATPRGVYQNYLAELKAAMTRGVGKAALLPPAATVPSGYRLAWSDEFEGAALDRSRWTLRADSAGGSTQLPRNVSVRGGEAIIAVNRVAASAGDEYTGGGIASQEVFGRGYYEVRLRVLAGRGWTTSFTLVPREPGPELRVAQADSGDATHYRAGANTVTALPLTDYHVFGCEAGERNVKYYLDGTLVEESPVDARPDARWGLRIASVATNAAAADSVDATRLPGNIHIDYVRYYKK